MTHCCGNKSHGEEENFKKRVDNKVPKSVVGKFLYKVGKADYEKNRKKRNFSK